MFLLLIMSLKASLGASGTVKNLSPNVFKSPGSAVACHPFFMNRGAVKWLQSKLGQQKAIRKLTEN